MLYFDGLGNSRKYPYPTTDGFHVLTPPYLRKSQNAFSPPMPSEFHNREPPLPFRISVIFCISYERKHLSDLSMLVFCFRSHTFVDNFIYELQKSTTIAFSRNSLYTFYSRNPTCGIPPCLRISNRKYPPMPSEFHNREPPLPFGNPKSRPWYGMDIFWNRPLPFFRLIFLLSIHLS